MQTNIFSPNLQLLFEDNIAITIDIFPLSIILYFFVSIDNLPTRTMQSIVGAYGNSHFNTFVWCRTVLS